MARGRILFRFWLFATVVCVASLSANAQSPTAQAGGSFMVQCPSTTPLHPKAISNPTITGSSSGTPLTESAEPAYAGPVVTTETVGGVSLSYTLNGGAVKCQEISGGDGYMTEADGNQTFMFSFGPLSGLDLIKHGQPGTLFAAHSNNHYNSPTLPSVCGPAAPGNCSTAGAAGISGSGSITDPTFDPGRPISLNGAIADPATIMTVGVLNGNIPAPLIAFDEDDEFFLSLSNVGMIMRPDLFEEHTVHFHGYPNASSYYDGVPDATWAINIGGSATYYYLAPDAGTYFWHCHITPPEHLQMGMVGQLYVRPRQNRVAPGGNLYAALQKQEGDLRTKCVSATDILCSNPLPAGGSPTTGAPRAPFTSTSGYAYNDGDGSTYYDVEYPIQMHGFDPNFHFVGMTFNPEGFADMKDKYFLLNGRSYPDTVTPGPLQTQSADGVNHFSQPLPAIIKITPGQRALLRISDLDVSEYQTLASLGIPMQVIGYNAKLLRDEAGNNLYYTTNSITLGGGESLDVILDTCLVRTTHGDPSSSCTTAIPVGTYYLYTPNLDHLSNDAENFGGQMTEVRVH